MTEHLRTLTGYPRTLAGHLRTLWHVLTSLKLTLVCLSLLMVLVVACTLAQVELGTQGAVNAYIRSFVVWWQPSFLAESQRWLPVFPGGATVGLALTVNLIAAQGRRLELSWRKSGLWLVHAGLILLVAGEFVTALFQVDMQMAIEEGQTLNYLESTRELELAVIDVTDSASDAAFGVPESLLARLGQTQALAIALVIEAVQQYLGQTRCVDEHLPGGALQLAQGWRVGRARRNQRRLAADALIAIVAPELLDQIFSNAHVFGRTEGRDRDDAQVARALHAEVQGFQAGVEPRIGHFLGRNAQALAQVRATGVDDHRWLPCRVVRPGVDEIAHHPCSWAQLDQQAQEPARGDVGQQRI